MDQPGHQVNSQDPYQGGCLHCTKLRRSVSIIDNKIVGIRSNKEYQAHILDPLTIVVRFLRVRCGIRLHVDVRDGSREPISRREYPRSCGKYEDSHDDHYRIIYPLQ
jgi:hypothetical protein